MPMPRNSPNLFVSLVLSLGVASCALFGGPNLRNLEFSSVTAIDVRNSVDAPLVEMNPFHDGGRVVVVSFGAERDLRAYAEKYEYNIGNDVSFCRGGEIDRSRLLQNDPYVFDKSGMVDAYHQGTSSSNQREYYIYIRVVALPLAGQSVFMYDLQRAPDDICIQLGGGRMFGDSFSSNTIVIPKEAVAAALQAVK